MSCNRRREMEKKRVDFLAAFDRDAQECRQSLPSPEQDQRLHNKHVKTLTFLQDIVNESKLLKERNQELESRLSECSHLHDEAKKAPERVKMIEKEYVDKLTEIEGMLVEKHETEVRRIVNEKNEEMRIWNRKEVDLENEVRELKRSLSDLQKNLTEARVNSDNAQIVQLKLDALSEENAILKEEQSRYVAENKNLRSEMEALLRVKQQNQTLHDEIQSTNQKLTELQLKHDKLSRDSEDSDNSGKVVLMDQAKNKLSKMIHERRLLTEKCQHLEAENTKLCEIVREYSTQLERSELLKATMLEEIENLKDELQKKKSRPNVEKDFREFVCVKRELSNLKEENQELSMKLRQKQRSQSLLPALKSPECSKVQDRKLSSGSLSVRHAVVKDFGV